MAGGAVARVFGVPEFRWLWSADVLSVLGDQLARVALSVLVFSRTGSAAAAALTYALTFLPALVGGLTLGWLADRFRRRSVMVGADLARAGLTAAMAIPHLPFAVLCGLLVTVVLLGTPHAAAQGALLPEVLGGQYEDGLAVRQMTNQLGQLVGFASGGVVVGILGPSAALLADAATFLLAACLVWFGVADRPRPARTAVDPDPDPDQGSGGSDGMAGPGVLPAGLRVILGSRSLRALVGLAWLVGWFVVPEALAAPYAAQLGGGSAVVGLLMAADPAGSVLGAWAFIRYVPADLRERLMGPFAVAAGLPLVALAVAPPLPAAFGLIAVSGMFSTAYLLQTQASFVRATPDHLRGRAIGVAAAGVVASQGVAVLLAGWAADVWGAVNALAATGVAGTVTTAVAALAWGRAMRARAAVPALSGVG